MKTIRITRSRYGLPCVGVGGGAMSNTFHGRFVLRDQTVAPAIFVRRHGSLSNELDQAIVPVKVGDVVVEVCGPKPVDLNNPNLSIEAGTIIGFKNEEAILQDMGCYPFSALPKSVIEGLSIYHNRDGRYFARTK